MCEKRKKADIIAGNTKRKIQQLKKIGANRSVKGKQRVSQKELKEEKIRRYWHEMRANELLKQVAAQN